MFFHATFVFNEDLNCAWRAGHNIPSSTPTNEATVYKTSRIVNKLIDKKGLLSLRAASLLTSGIVRMHRDIGDAMLEDCEQLERCIRTREESISNGEHIQEDKDLSTGSHRTPKSDKHNLSITYTRESQFSFLDHPTASREILTGTNLRSYERTSSHSNSSISKIAENVSPDNENEAPPIKKQKSDSFKFGEKATRQRQPETSQENVSQSVRSSVRDSRERKTTSSKNGTTPGSKRTVSSTSDGALQTAESPDAQDNSDRRRISTNDSSQTSRTESDLREASGSHEENSASENESNGDDSWNPAASFIEEDQIEPEWRPTLSTITEISEKFSSENTSMPCPNSEPNTTREKIRRMIFEATHERRSRKPTTMLEREIGTPGLDKEVRDKERLPSGQSVTPSLSKSSEDYGLSTLDFKESQKEVSPERENSILSGAREEQNRDPETEEEMEIEEDFELEAVRDRDNRAFSEGSPLLSAPVRTNSKDYEVQPELEEIRMSSHSNAEQNPDITEPQASNSEAMIERDDGLSSHHSSVIIPCSSRRKDANRLRKEINNSKNAGSPPTKGSRLSTASLPYVIDYYHCCDSLVPCAISHYKIDI